MIDVELRMVDADVGSIADATNFVRVACVDRAGVKVADVEMGFDREWTDDGDLYIGVTRYEDRKVTTAVCQVRSQVPS